MMVHTYSLATPYATIHDVSCVPSGLEYELRNDSGHLQTALVHPCQFDQRSLPWHASNNLHYNGCRS